MSDISQDKMDKDVLRQQLEDIGLQLKEKMRVLMIFREEYKAADEYKRIHARRKEVRGLKIETDQKVYMLKEEICSKFLKTPLDHYAEYTKGYTNILPEVLDAMKRHVKLSLLRGSDIMNLVNKMIADEMEGNEDLKKLVRKNKELCAEDYELYEKTKKLKEKSSDIEREIYSLRVRHDGVKTMLENPEKLVRHEDRIAERLKAEDPKTTDDILKTLRDRSISRERSCALKDGDTDMMG